MGQKPHSYDESTNPSNGWREPEGSEIVCDSCGKVVSLDFAELVDGSLPRSMRCCARCAAKIRGEETKGEERSGALLYKTENSFEVFLSDSGELIGEIIRTTDPSSRLWKAISEYSGTPTYAFDTLDQAIEELLWQYHRVMGKGEQEPTKDKEDLTHPVSLENEDIDVSDLEPRAVEENPRTLVDKLTGMPGPEGVIQTPTQTTSDAQADILGGLGHLSSIIEEFTGEEDGQITLQSLLWTLAVDAEAKDLFQDLLKAKIRSNRAARKDS